MGLTDRSVVSTSGRVIDEAAIASFERKLRGSLIRPDHPAYEAARRVWNRAFDKHPALIMRCADATDVQRAVEFARINDLLIAVRSGGHSSFATCDDGFLIDLSMMKTVEVDVRNRVARAEPGLTSGELDAATFAHGLVTPLGECPTTGIGGVTLGGGIGYLLGRHGLTCDNLVQAELIDANAGRLIASQGDDSDLLWALRGGGGNFGIVTSLTYRLYPMRTVLAGFLTYPLSQAAPVLHRVGDFAKEAPDELALIVMDDRRLTPERELCVLVCWSGELGRGERLMRRVRDFALPQTDSVREVSYVEFQRLLDAPPLEANAIGEIDFISEIDIRTAEALAACIASAPTLGCGITLELLHGAACRVGVADSAFSVRRPGFFAYITGASDDTASIEQSHAWVERVRRALSPLSPVSTGDTYVNGLGMLAPPEESRIRSGYGANYERLVALKNKYDPTNFFRMNQNIKPSV